MNQSIPYNIELIREIVREEIAAYFAAEQEPQEQFLFTQDDIMNPDYKKDRIHMMFYKRPRPWTMKEIKAYKKLTISDEDITQIELARAAGWVYYRKDLITLLNNWHEEVARATDYNNKQKPKHDSGLGF